MEENSDGVENSILAPTEAGRSPKVSIILPTYNGALHLRESIESCLQQTYTNIELVIVDDCSTDGTSEIVRSFRDERIKYIRHKRNRRLPRALNTGLSASTGAYLTWTSDDNQYLPRAIEEMVGVLERNHHVDLVCADVWMINWETGQKELFTRPDNIDLRFKNAVGSCFLFTRKAFQETGFYDPKYELVEDYEYWIRLCSRFKSLRYPYPLYMYGDHPNSLTRTKGASIFLLSSILKYQYNYITFRDLGESLIDYFACLIGSRGAGRINVGVALLRDNLKVFRISFLLGLLYSSLIFFSVPLKFARRILA
jgi:glycosyltransferase involved in cell wall biosynthesis